MLSEKYEDVVKANILNSKAFTKATFTGRQRRGNIAWIKVEIRPVLIKEIYKLQFVYYDEARAITKNYSMQEAQSKLDDVIGDGFKHIYIRLVDSAIQIQITKKGKALISRHAHGEHIPQDLSHDQEKARLLSAKSDDIYLKAVGIMSPDGTIKPSMQSKYRQVNEFLRLIEAAGHFGQLKPAHLEVIDCGAGNAYLTFAIYHYFANVLNIPTHVTGIDVDALLVERNNQKANELGWSNLRFEVSNILGYTPQTPPDIVLALHACDTATDEALAQAVKWNAQFIFSVPCCHHDIQRQLAESQAPEIFEETLQHGILKEHLGDILTDTFRSSILKMMGYNIDVIQFIASAHTAKNIMIQGVKATRTIPSRVSVPYIHLKEYWHLKPYLEVLLHKELAAYEGHE